ncbi:MAG: hypothetical protein U9P73_08705, partial [Candidatus Cloacimonadota bacterium]|nr:hypothetical protein [Candidatus Cloacimonadota bacterium]
RLSSIRSAQNNALTDILKIEDSFNENDLYSNLDWLSTHQESMSPLRKPSTAQNDKQEKLQNLLVKKLEKKVQKIEEKALQIRLY